MKKIFLILISVFLIFSCSDSRKDGLTSYDGKNFSINVPAKWEISKEKNKILPQPNIWVLELAISSKVELDKFSNSMTIISENLKEEIDSSNYSISNNISQKGDYSFYKEISKKNINLWKEKTTTVFAFDVKYNEQTPKSRIIQTWVVCWKKWYTLTIAIPTTTKDILKYEYIFSTFRCE